MVLKELFFRVSTLGECGGPERMIFNRYLWVGVVVLKELIFLTVSTLGGCGGLERTDLLQFISLVGVEMLKELIFYSFYFERLWCILKELILTVSKLDGCGGLERTDFYSSYVGRVWWS